MEKLTKEEQLKRVDDVLKKIEDKNFNIYFLIIDTKGNSSGSLEYLYQMAYTLFDMGYNVTMAYTDIHGENEEYVGPFDWLNEKYSKIPVVNVNDKNVMFGPEDFIFVPEILSDALISMKNKISSKRVLVVEDYTRFANFYPAGTNLVDLGIVECITTSNMQKEKIESIFPYLNVMVVRPFIENVFRPNDEPKMLRVNIASQSPSDRNRIVKEFYWKYPIYSWVTFSDIRGMKQEGIAEAFRTADITVWADDKTKFGYLAMEALRSGNIVVAKVPEYPTDWMISDNTLTEACIWYKDIDDTSDILASLIRSWTLDVVPEDVKVKYHLVDDVNTKEQHIDDVKEVVVDKIIQKRKDTFAQLKPIINSENKED